jgi:tetratricopeptide (TPR) repeat protein
LLVIDDVWHLEQAQTFQIGGPNCAHLFTTRQPALAYALAGEQAIQAHELDASTGAELLSSHAPGIVERHPEAVKQLVGAVGGLPLALSLMGRRLRSAALGNQTRRIAQTVQALVDEFGGHDGKPLAEVIALSEARLSSAERKALHALAVFPPKPASFTEAAAVAAADCDIALIDTLVDAGLVESMGERLRLHQTIADHARAALKHPEAVIERALAHYYGELLQNQAARDTGFASEEVAVAMALIDLAQGQALHGSAERCAALLAPLLIQRGQLDAAERILHQALMRPSAQDVPTSAMLHLARGRVAQRRGQFDIARAQFTAAEQALAGAVSDPAAACLQADVLLAQATLANDRGDREQADALGQRALAQARPLDDARLLSAILTQLAAAAGFRAQFPESEAYLLEARGFAERAGDQRAEALLSLGLGLIDSWLGNVADGEADFAHSYALAKASDAREIASIVRSMQGWVCANLGDYPRAISHSEESLALIREGGFCESAGLAYTNLGFIAMNQGRIDEAERLVEKGSAVVRQIGHKEGECMMYTSRARIACERGDWAYAERQAREGIQHCDALDYWELMPSLMATLGEALTMQGQYDDADGFLMTSLMLAHNMQRPWLQAYAYAVWGGCYLIREEVDRAQDMFDEALRIAERLGARPYAALALFGLARVAALRNDVVGAQALGKRALATFEEIGHVHAQHVRSWLASMQGV